MVRAKFWNGFRLEEARRNRRRRINTERFAATAFYYLSGKPCEFIPPPTKADKAHKKSENPQIGVLNRKQFILTQDGLAVVYLNSNSKKMKRILFITSIFVL